MMTGSGGESLSIGELSAHTGASVRALRYYEQHGLLGAERSSAGHRRFDPGAVEVVRRIRMFLDAGLPLAVVAQVVPCFLDDGARLHACVADYLSAHMHLIEERASALDDQRRTVQRLQRLIAA